MVGFHTMLRYLFMLDKKVGYIDYCYQRYRHARDPLCRNHPRSEVRVNGCKHDTHSSTCYTISGRRPDESRGVSNFAIQGPGGESRQFLSNGPVTARHQGTITHPKTIDNLPVHNPTIHHGHTNSFRLTTTRINGSTAPASLPLHIPNGGSPRQRS
jgi:hypothetical protein